MRILKQGSERPLMGKDRRSVRLVRWLLLCLLWWGASVCMYQQQDDNSCLLMGYSSTSIRSETVPPSLSFLSWWWFCWNTFRSLRQARHPVEHQLTSILLWSFLQINKHRWQVSQVTSPYCAAAGSLYRTPGGASSVWFHCHTNTMDSKIHTFLLQ